MTGKYGRPPSRGFSLLELVIVVAMTLVVSAVAIPAISATVYNVRLRTGVSNMSGLIQTGRHPAAQVRDS